MKNPKGSYNDDALDDLLKQYMLDEAAVGGRSADEWLETEADAVFASEPEHIPTKRKEAALIAELNNKLGITNKGGGWLWKGSALAVLLMGIVITTILFWHGTETPTTVATSTGPTDEGYEEEKPYVGSNTSNAPDTDNEPIASGFIADNTSRDTISIYRPAEYPAIVNTAPDTLTLVASVPYKPKNAGKTLLKELKRKLEAFVEQFPAERVYAQTDRADYLPGQNLWFAAYLTNEADLKPSKLSEVVKTELLNSSGEPVALKEWVATGGRVSGNLTIPQGLASGTYLFRAYTAWQHYLPGSKIFETPIVIQQPGQVLRIEDANIVASQTTMEFFPEGGDLVAGLQSRVAFQVSVAKRGVQGTIEDGTGATIGTFETNAQGQGLFTITPEAGKQYTAKIGTQSFALPAVYPSGYVMEVLGQEGNWVKANIKSTLEGNVVLVGQMRGNMYYGVEHSLQVGDNWVKIPVNNMPAGVMHLSLFDTDGVGHAERLVFVNKQKQLHVTIKTDKTNYLPREKVTAQINVTDDKGRPVQTTLSLSATDNLLTHTENTNILSALLLEPDLGGVAHHAGYLFDPANKNADAELDLLLMTQGWRRFTWKEVYYNLREPLVVAPEHAVLKGKVVDAVTGKPLKGIQISNKALGIKTSTAADGSFYIPNIDLTEMRELDLTYKIGVMSMIINRYQDDLVIEFTGDARKVYQPMANSRQHPVLTGKQKAPKGTAIAGQVVNAYGNGIAGAQVTITAPNGKVQQVVADAQGYYLVLTETATNYKVQVTAHGYNPYQNLSVKTEVNKFSMLDVLLPYQVDMNNLHAHFTSHVADTFANRYSFLAGQFDHAYNNPAEESSKLNLFPEVRTPLRDGVTAYYMEGMKLKYNEPLMLPLSAIGHMEMFDNGLSPKHDDGTATTLDVTTGANGGFNGIIKAPENRPTGFAVRYAQPREYPKTQYSVRDRSDDRTDLRSTIHWDGDITTDGNGNATVEFYASDDLSAFRLIVEGIGSNGMPGRTEQLVGMEWPFDIQAEVPKDLRKGDKIVINMWVNNATGKQITGNFDFTIPAGLKPIWPLAPKEHGLFPGRMDTIPVQFEVIDPQAVGTLIIGFTAGGYRDLFTYKMP